jgi:hypothetical protein
MLTLHSFKFRTSGAQNVTKNFVDPLDLANLVAFPYADQEQFGN